jgi:hypothetical protein
MHRGATTGRRAVALAVGASVATAVGIVVTPAASATRPRAAQAAMTTKNLVSDGDFSTPAATLSHPGAFQGQGLFTDFCATGYTDPDCPTAYPTFGSWQVTSGSIDVNAANYIAAPTGAPTGTQSVDLDGYTQRGAIAQTLATRKRKRYTGTFMLAANPAGTTPPSNAVVKRVAVTIGKRTIARFSFNDTGDSQLSMGYKLEHFHFTAAGPKTVLGFRSLDAKRSSNGPEISEIAVQ